jgi:DNA repair protein RadC
MMTLVPEFKISLKMKKNASELEKIINTADAAKVCREIIGKDKIDWIEQSVVIGLNKSNKVLGFYKVSEGGLISTALDIRVIMQFALLSNSVSLILCHNHPSGNIYPSKQDKDVTYKITKAASYLDIKIDDHIIITSESYYSFWQNGDIVYNRLLGNSLMKQLGLQA